jgi:hypothetical protein
VTEGRGGSRKLRAGGPGHHPTRGCWPSSTGRLLGYRYRPGDEPPPAGEPDPQGRDWLVLRDPPGASSWRSSRWPRCPR